MSTEHESRNCNTKDNAEIFHPSARSRCFSGSDLATLIKFGVTHSTGSAKPESMQSTVFVPSSSAIARSCVEEALDYGPENLDTADFLKAYHSLVYLYPGIHPESMDDWDGPVEVVPLIDEAIRRAEASELGESQLYPYQTIQARLFEG